MGGFSKVLDHRGNSLSQNGIAILATISSTHYLLSTSSKQRNKCSRIELKMTETNKATASISQHLLLCSWLCGCVLCQMPIASITNGFTETLNCSGGVTRQNPPTPKRRVTPPRQTEGWSPTKVRPLPRCQKLTVDERAPSIVYLTKVPAGSLSSSDAVCRWHHLRRGLSSDASESESEVLAGSTWWMFPQSDGNHAP